MLGREELSPFGKAPPVDRKGAKRGRAAAERGWSGDGSGRGFQETGALWPGRPGVAEAPQGAHHLRG